MFLHRYYKKVQTFLHFMSIIICGRRKKVFCPASAGRAGYGAANGGKAKRQPLRMTKIFGDIFVKF